MPLDSFWGGIIYVWYNIKKLESRERLTLRERFECKIYTGKMKEKGGDGKWKEKK